MSLYTGDCQILQTPVRLLPAEIARAPRDFSRPLRVIHVGPCLLPGGAEQWLIDLTRSLDPNAVQLLRTIVTNPKMVDPAFAKNIPVPVEVGGAEAVRRAARECDILLTWGIPLDEWLGDCRPPICVFVAHGEGDWTKMLVQMGRNVIDHVVAVSHAVEKRMGSSLPTTVIYNGVDTSRLGQSQSREDSRRSLGFEPNDFVVAYIGRFSPEKRPHLVIDAVARLPRHCKALLVGWGALGSELLERANSSIPSRYAFTMAREYLGDLYLAADAVVLASDQEGFPLVMIESMHCGRPLIATPVGCIPEIIVDRVNGLIVSGDANSIAKAVELLLSHPRWAHGLAQEGKDYADRHGHARRMAREYEALFHRLWHERAGRTTEV